jgi:methylamine dehydrogenase heavy chain
MLNCLRLRTLLLALLFLVGAAAAFAQVPTSPSTQFPYPGPPTEGVSVLKMPAPGRHWAFIMAPLYGNFLVSQIYVIDGDSAKILGMMTGGLLSTAAVSPDRSRIYVADTFFSRGTRGARTDVVTIYDTKTLAPTGEVVIPPRRLLAAPDNLQLKATSDGRLLLVANMTPATSVTVIDTAGDKVVGEIPTPGCPEFQLVGARRFVSLCGDGAMLSVGFDDAGKVRSEKRSKPFFDPEKDPVYAYPAIIGTENYYVTYHGMVHPMDVASDPPVAGASWSLVSDQEKAQGWRPGGAQPFWGHSASGLIYVLMHQGGEWTHKQPGAEVWVFRAKDHRRVQRLTLPEAASSIYVSSDKQPLIFAATPTDVLQFGAKPFTLQVLAADGRYLGKIDQLGGFPAAIFGL